MSETVLYVFTAEYMN